MPAGSSSLALLDRSFVAVGLLIDNIRPEQWSWPTPCTDWNLREVVRHLVGLNRLFTAMLNDAPAPQRWDDIADDEIPTQYRESAALLMAAFSVPGVLERAYQGPLGSATGAERLSIRLYDLLAHCWDIAQATGQAAVVPEDAVEHALAFARQQVRDDARAGRFGPPQVAPAHASSMQQLVAFLGRPVA